jgi:hypothetical protein
LREREAGGKEREREGGRKGRKGREGVKRGLNEMKRGSFLTFNPFYAQLKKKNPSLGTSNQWGVCEW